MRVDFLVSDVSSPVIGPVTTLARHLEATHQVRIVGPDLGHGVCAMYRDSFPYTVLPLPRMYRFPNYFTAARKLSAELTGDVIIAVKAVGNTIPVALWTRRRTGCKVMAYLDEWDGAVTRMKPPGARAMDWLRHAHHPMEDNYTSFVEGLIPRVDHVISTTTFLQAKFGGSVLPVGVDCDHFKPAPESDVRALKLSLGLEGFKLIVFGGVARPHKGLEWILEAMAETGRTDLRFLVVGPRNEHAVELTRHPKWGSHVILAGPQPHDRMPLYLSLADLIVLPQKDNLLAQSQMPCKVFEAMAMERPVIASAVADLPAVLNGCGLTVPAGDVQALARAMGELLGDPGRARSLGELARKKCIEKYSDMVTRRDLLAILDRFTVSETQGAKSL